MKICGVCKLELDESRFHRKGSGLQYQCKDCQKKYRDGHYEANKNKYIANARAFGIRSKAWLDTFKDKPCMDCGVSYPPYVMDFDHRPGEQKLFDIGSAARERSRSVILVEMAKCDLVCANCHRVRTWTRAKST